MFIMTKEILLAGIDAMVVALDPTSMHVRLYKTPVSISIDSVVGDFTEADYTGYAAITLTGANPATWRGEGAAAEFLTPPAVFQPSGTTLTNVVYGYYLTMGAGAGVLIGAEAFATPYPMGDPADQIIVATVLGIRDGGLPAQVY